MAHGVGPRASRPHQAGRTAGRKRRAVLTYAQGVRVAFEEGRTTKGHLTDVERWAASTDRLAGRV
jgi:hypothetical protein